MLKFRKLVTAAAGAALSSFSLAQTTITQPTFDLSGVAAPITAALAVGAAVVIGWKVYGLVKGGVKRA